MLLRDVITISSRSFKNNRLRTLLTVLGISIGIGAIFFLVSLGYGFQKLILERIATEDSLLSLDVSKRNESVKLDEGSMESIKEIKEVVEIHPMLSTDSSVEGNNVSSVSNVRMVNPEFFSLEGLNASEGALFEEGENDKMVVSLGALQLLSIDPDKFKENDIEIRMIKNLAQARSEQENQDSQQAEEVETGEEVLSDQEEGNKEEQEEDPSDYVEKTYAVAGVIDDPSIYMYIPFESMASDIHFEEYDKLKVKVSSTTNIENTRSDIIDKGFYVSSVSETVEQARQIFTIAQVILVLFGVVALVVSAIGMFNTMTIALLERTQEIGIMKAIGASVYDIWKMFLTESMMIGFFGGVFGIVLGYIASQLLNFGINWLATSFGGDSVTLFVVPVWFVLFIIIFSTSVGLITGFYPARRAARLNALEALRYK